MYVPPQPGAKQKPGQIEANIDGKTRALLYSEKDSTITLLQGDHVTFNLLTDIVSQNIRATNIRPKTPQTFKITGEKREVVSLSGTPIFLHFNFGKKCGRKLCSWRAARLLSSPV